ncbi:MAG: tight adherence protein, partial [Nocardioidaceae bacterium]|nr:tight adherence protein [Nocardioidaceae bacterium]
MTASLTGALLGTVAGLGLWLVANRVVALRRGAFKARVLRHLQDVPTFADPRIQEPSGPLRLLFGPVLQSAATRLEAVLGGTASIRRRIERAGIELTVLQFRVLQVFWGAVGLIAATAVAILLYLRSP